MSQSSKSVTRKTLLGFPLTAKQDVLYNYLIPSTGACFLYVFLLATEISLIHRHFKDGNYVWAWITLVFLYLPAFGSCAITLSSLELWPDVKLWTKNNIVWVLIKIVQHLLFPIWSLWRFAERIFWSIEAYRSEDDDSREYAIFMATSPRTIELYIFLQAFLQSLPQVLFQLCLLMRHSHTTDKQTAYAQFLSIAFNIMKLSITVTYYQRFKTQKLAGSKYPWHKFEKYQFDPSLDEVTLRRKTLGTSMIPSVYKKTKNIDSASTGIKEEAEEDLYEPVVNRRSSDIYLDPEIRGSYLPAYSSRIQSEADGPKRFSRWSRRQTYNSSTSSNDCSEPDFNIRRILYIKGLPEDDLAGKLIAFCWWSAFLLARVLAISAFQYFYPAQVLYILVAHFLLTLALLCYDAKSNEVTRSKAVFFLFVCYIYLFCIIEFKIKFKKTYFIYFGFFSIVYLENFVMCMVWWYGNLKSIETDFWFKYCFYIIITCSICSFASMIFYFTINKPKKVVVGQVLK
ncbi:hypothetical protein WA026_006779 [Henosepilachna vigintioctopunctata]|uniref:XK-related protein n=1 Tax=Henosepilachna vigintioctopunctata TaxID=420089 RepID=A0AAW1UK04_9CUCU